MPPPARPTLPAAADRATLTRDTEFAGVKTGSWVRRQRTTSNTLTAGQQQLMTPFDLTPEANPLAPACRSRRTFEETVQLLELFPHREGCVPAARETVRVDGDTAKLGAWLAKTRHRHRSGQLPDFHVRLVAALFDGTGRPRTPYRPLCCRALPG